MTMKTLLRTATAGVVVALTMSACSEPAMETQAEAARLEITTASAESRAALESALNEWFNVFITRATAEADRAVTLDSTFGLARAVRANLQASLSPEEQEAELDRAVADAAGASQGEFLLASSIRAQALGRTAEARALADVAVRLVPGDPNVAYMRAMVIPAAERLEPLREVTVRFPDFAPAFNILAYSQWAANDTAGALQSVQRYVELMPDHPNSHDSYAELLQFTGRHDEAIEHYNQATALDAEYVEGYAGVGEVESIRGNAEAARAAFTQAAELSTGATRFNYLAIIAASHLIDGTPADAVREMMVVAREAEQQNQPAVAATIHRNAALLEAVFGNNATAATHLSRAGQLGNADAPVQHRYSAIIHALAGRHAEADVAAARFDELAAAGNAVQRQNAHEVRAVLAAVRQDVAGARTHLEQAGPSLLGRALLAQTLQAGGSTEEAQQLKDEVLRSNTVTYFDFLAREKARKM